MIVANSKHIVITSLIMGAVGTATAVLTCRAVAGPEAKLTVKDGGEALRTSRAILPSGTVAGESLATWVERRVQQWQSTAAERRFDEIGWAKDIRDAERIAREHGRPVFLFTHDGRMAIGRC